MEKTNETVLHSPTDETVTADEVGLRDGHETKSDLEPSSVTDPSDQGIEAPPEKPKSVLHRILKEIFGILGVVLLLVMGIGLLVFLYVFITEATVTTQLILAISTGLALLLLLLWKVPKWQISHLTEIAAGPRFELENEARKTLAQLIAGVLVVTGLYGTWRTLQVSEQGQVTERFNKAIDQLATEKLSTRLGAIYSLERLSQDSHRDHNRIIEILTAYVRENAPLKEATASPLPSPGSSKTTTNEDGKINYEREPRADIQAILNVLNRRSKPSTEDLYDDIDLSETNLYGASLFRAYLHKAKFYDAQLSRVSFLGATLTKARFLGAILRDADFTFARLNEADFSSANLEAADLGGADVTGADFEYARGLTAGQVKEASNYDKAKWPPPIARSLGLSQQKSP